VAYCVSELLDSVMPTYTGALEPLKELAPFAGRLDVPAERFWGLAFQICMDSNGNYDLAERLCIRTLPQQARTPQLMSELRAALQSVMTAFDALQPRYYQEMQLREAPLRQQWEAFGPGIWRQLGLLLEPDLFVEQAEICLVTPVLGGFGWAHHQTNRCHIEAVLTNANPQITEVMRLAWLLGQLDFERPKYSDWINSMRLRKVAGLAMLPPILLAGEELGLCCLNPASLKQAIELWRIETPGNKAEALAGVLQIWWDTFRSGKTDWSIALTGLDRMMS
jgi:hypothetical protein